MQIALISVSTYPGDQGLRVLSSCLKRNGHKVLLIFLPMGEQYTKLYPAAVLKQLRELCISADVIGVSAYVSTAPRALQVINALKTLNKPIVYGGIHPTIDPDDCIRHADIVCIGEAEHAMLELVSKIANNEDVTTISNFWIKRDGQIYRNSVRNLIEDIDTLPYPDYDLEDHYILEKNRIIKFQERHLNGQIFFLTGRGCPYACTYCSNSLINKLYIHKGKVVRWHSPDYITNAMRFYKGRFKTLGYFDIRDDTFSIRTTEDIKEFCERYKERVGMRFKCLADPVTVNNEKVKMLVDAGCTDIIVGIQGQEKVNFNVFKRYQKDEQVIKCAAILNRYKDRLRVMYDVITCNPYEEAEDITALIRLLQKLPKPYYLSVNNLVFFPGTELYNRARRDGIIKTEGDAAADLNYWDRYKHIKLKKKNAYLNLILNLMRGSATERRFGVMPNFLLNLLLSESLVRFNLKHPGFTFFVGYFVGISDCLREKVAKPLFRSMPSGFKAWYDKVRYRL